MLFAAVLAVATLAAVVIGDAAASTHMPPAWMKVLAPTCLLAGAGAALWLWGWAARRLSGRFRWWVVAPALVLLGLAQLAAGLVMLVVVAFDSTADWQRVVDLDGTVYWEEFLLPDGRVYHRELPGGRVRSVGEYWCDDPGCGPPLRRARWERAVAAAEQSPASPVPDQATGAPSQSSPQPSAESDRVGVSFPQVRRTLPAMAVTVTDASGQIGLTGRGIEVARREGGAWRPIGSIPSTGEPVLLVCQDARCLAGIGTAGGGEVWTSADHGVTWTDHSGDLPSSLPAEQRFLTSATLDATGATWTACLSYPSWVGSDAQPVCVPVAG